MRNPIASRAIATIAVAALLLGSPTIVCAPPNGATSFADTPTWIWSKKDLRAIGKIEPRVTETNGWFEVETAAWHVRTEIDPRFTAEVAHFMDRVDAALGEILTGVRDGKAVEKKPTVVIYAEQSTYERKFPGGTRGYFRYDHSPERWSEFHLYSFIERPAERTFKFFYTPILVHEGAHVLLRARWGIDALPEWLDEGISTYFQFWNLQQSGKANLKARYGRSIYRKDLLRAYEGGPPRLAELLAVTEWNPDAMGERAKRNYALGESFIDFLLASKEGRKLLRRTVERLRAGEPLFDEEEVVRLEAGWHARIRKVLSIR